MSAVLENLAAIRPEVAKRELDTLEVAEPSDQVTGIFHTLVSTSRIYEGGFGFEIHVARVKPGTNVNPHVHYKGFEPYRVLDGNGAMYLGRIDGNKVVWQPPSAVKAGDLIEVQEGEVHCLRNPSSYKSLDFLFACPPQHLIDAPAGDRLFTMGLDGGIPDFAECSSEPTGSEITDRHEDRWGDSG